MHNEEAGTWDSPDNTHHCMLNLTGHCSWCGRATPPMREILYLRHWVVSEEPPNEIITAEFVMEDDGWRPQAYVTITSVKISYDD
jgi:hypothetical protein